jgi:sarcosine oxidase subunit beta
MIQSAVFMPQAGYISDPQLATHNVQRAAEVHGAEFRFNSEVGEIRRDRGRVTGVTLKDAWKVDAPVVVNAAGPHSSKINRIAGIEEGLNIKTRALRREVAHVPSPAGFDFEKDGFVGSDNDVGVYYRPEVGNHILVGSMDPQCDGHEYVDPDDFKTSLTRQATAQVYRLAQRFPDIGFPNQLRGVIGCYDVSDDWIPIYDKSDLDGFYLAIGTSGNQFKNAPVVGAMMAELINACEEEHDHDQDPLQFLLRYTNRTINVGFYSRRREINLESSFSVMG